jgi:hypothetical protein
MAKPPPGWLDMAGKSNNIHHLKDAPFHLGADPSVAPRLEGEHGIFLPAEHWEVLQWSNGLEAYAGYVRLFGIYNNEGIDSVVWNERDYWKFAWGDRCDGWWCFGESSWGDQYAYSLESLRRGKAVSVYFIDAVSMTAQVRLR